MRAQVAGGHIDGLVTCVDTCAGSHGDVQVTCAKSASGSKNTTIYIKVVKNAFSWGFIFLHTVFAQIKVFGAVKNRLSWG